MWSLLVWMWRKQVISDLVEASFHTDLCHHKGDSEGSNIRRVYVINSFPTKKLSAMRF